MCGIAGFNWNSEKEIIQMLEVQKSRGPDNISFKIEPLATLGHNRLSIIDLNERSNQPMYNDSRNLVIVFNGEIYNYEDIREKLTSYGFKFHTKSDTEVLLKAYEYWGPKCLNKLIGMFSFCIYDVNKNYLFLARDHIGIKPLYFYSQEGKFIFSSTIKAIKKLVTNEIRPNDEMIRDFLIYNMTDHTNQTFFEKIEKLPKASFMIYNLNSSKYKIYKWYDFSFKNIKTNHNFESYVIKLRNELSSSVNLRLVSDVPVGTSLSGGIDSSSIACLIKKSRKSKIKTFSGIFPGFTEDESKYINIIKDKLDMENYSTSPNQDDLLTNISKYLKNLEEPSPTTNPFLQYMVFKLAKENNVTVMLDGQGADELFGGYKYFFGFYLKGLLLDYRFSKFLFEFIKLLVTDRSVMPLLSLFYLLLPKELREKFLVRRSLINNNFYNSSFQKKSFGIKYYSQRNLHCALKFHLDYKLEHLLTWEDRNSMAHSVEARVPFLDKNVMELVSQMPEDFIIRNGQTKFILRDSMRNIVPDKILNRNDKIGYKPPDVDWLKTGQVQKIIKSYFIDSEPLCKKYINIKKFQKIILNNKEKNSPIIWKIFMLESWFREFFPSRL